MRWASHLALGLSEVLWPPRCAACDAFGSSPFCPSCALTLEAPPWISIAGLHSASARFLYGGAIAEAIVRLKYQRKEELGLALAPLLAECCPKGAEVVVPVPLAPSRLRARGFNQAGLLAARLGLPRAHQALVRLEGAQSQVGAGRRARTAQVQGAFRVAQPPLIAGRRVLLVDDVITTGATARAAASVLVSAGAAWVGVFALACAEPRMGRSFFACEGA